MKKEMKLMELAELVYKMKDDEVIDFAPGDEEEVEFDGGWCGVKKINEFSNDNPMYLVSHYGGEAEARLYHISEYDDRIGDFVGEEIDDWHPTEQQYVNCCARMLADFFEDRVDYVPEVITVERYENDTGRTKDWRNIFPDYKEIKPGDWSKYGEVISYEPVGSSKRRLEIGLYREPDDKSYTIQIFFNDDVILCENLR